MTNSETKMYTVTLDQCLKFLHRQAQHDKQHNKHFKCYGRIILQKIFDKLTYKDLSTLKSVSEKFHQILTIIKLILTKQLGEFTY